MSWFVLFCFDLLSLDAHFNWQFKDKRMMHFCHFIHIIIILLNVSIFFSLIVRKSINIHQLIGSFFLSRVYIRKMNIDSHLHDETYLT